MLCTCLIETWFYIFFFLVHVCVCVCVFFAKIVLVSLIFVECNVNAALAMNRLIAAKHHASIQINVGHLIENGFVMLLVRTIICDVVCIKQVSYDPGGS